MQNDPTESLLALTDHINDAKSALKQRLAGFRKEYDGYKAELQAITVPAAYVSFDGIASLRERIGRHGGYIAALEFALQQLGEKV
jgi:hypothetical protein